MSTPRLTTLRDHFQAMSEAEHLPDCPSITARGPFWSAWTPRYGPDGIPQSLLWRGPKPKWEPPKCDGCVSAEDRALFARLADEVGGYLDAKQGALFP